MTLLLCTYVNRHVTGVRLDLARVLPFDSARRANFGLVLACSVKDLTLDTQTVRSDARWVGSMH